jgi:antitoxin component YwqK of YwqJK toxin-antitoxin module
MTLGRGFRTTAWDEDGAKRQGSFAKGKRHGEIRGWHANGQPAFVTNWVEGKADGKTQGWHASGAPALRGEWKLGKKIQEACWDAKGKKAKCKSVKKSLWKQNKQWSEWWGAW